MVIEILVQKTDISVVKDLDFTNLQKFWIYVGYTTFQRSAYFESNVLQFNYIDYQSFKISQLNKKCAILSINRMKDLKNFTSQLLHDCPIPCLKDITVVGCPNLEYLIDSNYNDFPQIKSLSLIKLENLKEMCHASNHDEVKGSLTAFSNLEKLELIDLPCFIGFNNSINFNELNQESKFAIENGENISRFHSDPKNCTPSYEFSTLFSSNWMKHFPKLEIILLKGCISLNVMFDLEGYLKSSGQALDLLFPQLTKIEISNLKNLSFVWGIVPHYVQGFQNLRFLTISNCDSLKHVFTSTIAREITNLEELEVRSCKLIENKVAWNIDFEKVVDDNKELMATIGFNKLQCLSLSSLPELVSMCSNSVKLDCPSLKQFDIVGCPMLEISFVPTHINAKGHNLNATYFENTKDVGFPIYKEHNSRFSTCSHSCMPFLTKCFHQGNTSKKNNKDEYVGDHISIRHHQLIDESLFPNLTSLFINGCNKINILFSHSSISSLQHLRELKLLYCENIEEIISHKEETETSGNMILFCALQHLLLENLPNLNAFFQGHCNLDFPSLQNVVIKDCPNMEVFSRGIYDTPKLESLIIYMKSHRKVYTEKNDINVAIKGFKAFVASEGFKMMNWKKLRNEGYFMKNNQIFINRFNNLVMLVSYHEVQMLQHVKELLISSCDSLVEVFGSGEGTKKGGDITHYELQEISLYILPKLNHIWKHNITKVVSFTKLKYISVRYCHNLKNLVSHSMARSLELLEELDVKQCNIMEEIITKEDEIIKGGNKVKILFPKLESLTLEYLPNLECVCSGDYDYDIPLCTIGEENEINNNKIQISFPNLKELVLSELPRLKCFSSGVYDYNIMVSSIKECSNMKTFPHGNVVVKAPNLHYILWDRTDRQTLRDLNLAIHYIQNKKKYEVELQKIETFRDINAELVGYIKTTPNLVIKNNHRLLNCIPSNMMHLFSHLQKLTVRECDCLQEIFESNENMLQCLFSFPQLKHIWKNQGHNLGFEFLEEITIMQCNDLEHVFPYVSMVTTSLPKLYLIIVYDCRKMKEIIGNNCNPINCVQQKKPKIQLRMGKIKLNKLPNIECFCRSSFTSYVEFSFCHFISIKDCPKMKTFWDDAILCAPYLNQIYVDNILFSADEGVNEVIQRHNK